MNGTGIDLHAHSTASDGTDDPADLVRAAAGAGLRVLAITDHDTTAGWAEAAGAAVRHGVRLVPGAELSCRAAGVSVHMLSYLHDPDDTALVAECRSVCDDRLGRAERMVGLIAADFDLSWDDVLDHVGEGATVGRPHIADAMVARGLVSSREEAFATVLNSTSPYYLRHHSPDAVTTVRRIRTAGGVPVMAHPRARTRGRVVTDEVIAELATAGLAGVEADHRDNSEADRAHLRGLAADLGLLVTGSSDFHGRGKPNRLGEFTTDPDVLEAIVAQARGAEVVAG